MRNIILLHKPLDSVGYDVAILLKSLNFPIVSCHFNLVPCYFDLTTYFKTPCCYLSIWFWDFFYHYYICHYNTSLFQVNNVFQDNIHYCNLRSPWFRTVWYFNLLSHYFDFILFFLNIKRFVQIFLFFFFKDIAPLFQHKISLYPLDMLLFWLNILCCYC